MGLIRDLEKGLAHARPFDSDLLIQTKDRHSQEKKLPR